MNRNQLLVIFGWKMQVSGIVDIPQCFDMCVLEPIPSTMDNWGEGVVPACREERPQRYILE